MRPRDRYRSDPDGPAPGRRSGAPTRRVRDVAAAAAVGVAPLLGCGGETPPPAPPPPVAAPPAAAVPAPPPPPAAPPRPRFDPADLDALARLYDRLSQGDQTAFEAGGLTDAAGIPDPEEVARYTAAIRAQHADPARWEAFMARVRTGGAP